jgi:putative component of toxin-antitoxin plasmid stabilization module
VPYVVKQLEEFSAWLTGQKDTATRLHLVKRMRKAQLGNLGDIAPVGGGDKSTQPADIRRAIAMAKSLED